MKPSQNPDHQPLEYYLSLKYPISLYPVADGGYTVTIPDLPGCITQGDTLEEALDNINEARELWIETVYCSNEKTIPLPSKNY
ncbi:type II toxin-antitoxin system HicB family antitoxin [Spirulina sp. CS-785/01]|uniref:type II toxin-antitoxin system HicB family antitoxin n=1 Tax=Spirulina sp. CS-785/01 TaxID=3021716 RepID=UPI00232EF085|nr:type II toxin-antitoxin system HicB family antitoxin [Spirulina sp. CS-785/01]MDB9312299.1 type II toxin-antitoxin system HicB family antitoxin [Spirulina sp. CS-785/01]